MSDIKALVDGFSGFRNQYMKDSSGRYKGLADYGPHSRILVIACCDSRADPAIITNSSTGDMMVIRNIANLVPPHLAVSEFQETDAALEFASLYLELEHIIVLGHSRCGGVRSLLTRLIDDMVPDSALDSWMSVAEPAAKSVLADMPDASLDDQACACSRRALVASLDNLRHYPGVAKRLDAGQLQLHGWYFNLASGELQAWDEEGQEYVELV
ncbi:carbonic anhydrase [Halieaceae bacterium IMCC14734]|uniref:carbonic anhydrase n=1 Tax=Candidatus Litorirhabdus singularis TaxID=2518993 RepID=A0ABT3TD21_9GAMM|nr:carbonic anhydrase [Candidatus Litorirhabdus singularis]MCX2980198.1 carbonic anhydrase [Candidatus Litorirhabdus singularis]